MNNNYMTYDWVFFFVLFFLGGGGVQFSHNKIKIHIVWDLLKKELDYADTWQILFKY